MFFFFSEKIRFDISECSHGMSSDDSHEMLDLLFIYIKGDKHITASLPYLFSKLLLVVGLAFKTNKYEIE